MTASHREYTNTSYRLPSNKWCIYIVLNSCSISPTEQSTGLDFSKNSILFWMPWIIDKLATMSIACVWRPMFLSLRAEPLATTVRSNWSRKDWPNAMSAHQKQHNEHFPDAPFVIHHRSQFIALFGRNICSSEFIEDNKFSSFRWILNFICFSIPFSVNCSVSIMRMRMSRQIQLIRKQQPLLVMLHWMRNQIKR